MLTPPTFLLGVDFPGCSGVINSYGFITSIDSVFIIIESKQGDLRRLWSVYGHTYGPDSSQKFAQVEI